MPEKVYRNEALHFFCQEMKKEMNFLECFTCYTKTHKHKLGITRDICKKKNKREGNYEK